MKLSNKAAALAAFSLAIRPLVRLMLGSGIVWKQAADTLKESFVEVAESEYGLHGRVANASRVAILTGLNRRDVKRVRDTMTGDSKPALARMNSATRLLGAWHTDPAFQAADGKPTPLSTEDDDTGFGALCRRYAADIPVTAMLKELTRVGAVSESPDGFVRPLKRYYMPDPLDADAVIRAGNVLGDLASTVEFNLQINSTRDSEPASRAAPGMRTYPRTWSLSSANILNRKARPCWNASTSGWPIGRHLRQDNRTPEKEASGCRHLSN